MPVTLLDVEGQGKLNRSREMKECWKEGWVVSVIIGKVCYMLLLLHNLFGAYI